MESSLHFSYNQAFSLSFHVLVILYQEPVLGDKRKVVIDQWALPQDATMTNDLVVRELLQYRGPEFAMI